MKARGEKNGNWKGGRPFITKFGYIKVTTPYNHPRRKQSKNNGWYIFEHRLIMEKHLGRYLQPNEFVHHINGIKTDNRVENLIVITKQQHNAIHLNAPNEICNIPKCDHKRWALGLCNKHYKQYRKKTLNPTFYRFIQRTRNHF